MVVDGNSIKEKIIDALQVLAAKEHKRVYFVQFGTDKASTAFVGVKLRLAKRLGIMAEYKQFDIANTDDIIAAIKILSETKCDGIVVQLPLPDRVDTAAVVNSIPERLDIDVLSDEALTMFSTGKSLRMPPVAAAVQAIVATYNVSLIDKRIVIRGKGRLVGEPVMRLFDTMNISYTTISNTTPAEEQQRLLQQADIVISGIGVPHSLTPDMIKNGVVLIDAGTSEQQGKLQGDIDPNCADKASLYTPIPGGVGPITVACLFKNLFL